MTEEKVKYLLKTKVFNLEQEVLNLICGLSVFTDKTDAELEKMYNIDSENLYDENLISPYINLYNDVEELKKKLQKGDE